MDIYTAESAQRHPKVVAFSDSSFGIFWASDQLKQYLFQLHNSDGSLRQVMTDFKRPQSIGVKQISVAENLKSATGEFVVAFSSYDIIGDTSEFGIALTKFDLEGIQLETEFVVNQYIPSSQVNPTLAQSDEGNFGVFWQTPDVDQYSNGIIGAIYDEACSTKLKEDFIANTYKLNS